MKNFSISQSLSQGWDLLKTNILLVVITFITCIPLLFSEGASHVFPVPPITTTDDIVDCLSDTLIPLISVSFVLQIIAYALEGGLYNAAMKVVRGGKADFNCFNMPASVYIKFICAMICYNLLIAIGFCFCIIPGILFAVRFMFLPYIVVDDPYCNFTDAFQRSWDMTRGNFWNLFAFTLVCVLIAIIGLVFCCVGILVAIPLVTLAEATIYMELKPEDEVIIENV